MTGVGHADPEAPFRGDRIERNFPGRKAPQRFQNFPARADQRIGLRRRRHAGRRSYEERILQMFPQTPQPDADRRLTLSQLFGHARHAADIVEEIEQLQQLQIREWGRTHITIALRNDVIAIIALREWASARILICTLRRRQ
ncbi:hypothetical protein BVI1335_190052 [Burkholderia vietnamiensis]|nr:hypothetical protein BVI1335_190052 [Burkholderia vietnamiensis]